MRFIDITAPLGPGTPVYPGDPPVDLTPLPATSSTGGFTLSRLTLGTHAGTHVDPPAHLLPGGTTVDRLALETLIGPAWLLDVDRGRPVTAADLAILPRRSRRLLLRTGGRPLSEEAAHLIVRRGVRLVGVDGLSVDPVETPGPVHRLLLAGGVIIVEGLVLVGVPPGRYGLLCLPLRLVEGDGAPARVVLIDRGRGRNGHR